VGRRTLVALELVAAVDSGPRSVHVQDLLALDPTESELEEAQRWAMTQDVYEGFTSMIAQVIEHVRRDRP
jgi:hypothetical protein